MYFFKVFPRLTKCTFYNYGASGTLQAHDALCVLGLNIINEKVNHLNYLEYMKANAVLKKSIVNFLLLKRRY